MNRESLQATIQNIKKDFELAITTSMFNEIEYDTGQKAKEALIRSQKLIIQLHEVAKISLSEELKKTAKVKTEVFPAIGKNSPELCMFGFLKAKKQDVVALFSDKKAEKVIDGLLTGKDDSIGKLASEQSIIIGVRSQLSSVAKNFDTLMERAFAETLNLRLRLPNLVMGEVYLLPTHEYDDKAMENNEVKFKQRATGIEKYIKTFLAISNRNKTIHAEYRYNRTALILADFKQDKVEIIESSKQLVDKGLVTNDFIDQLKAMRDQEMVAFDDDDFFKTLSPYTFSRGLIESHREYYPSFY